MKCDCEWQNFIKKQYEEEDIMGSMNEKEKIEYNKMLKETSKPLSSHAVLCEVIAEIEDQSSDLGEHYITIDKDKLENILGNYYA